MGECFLYRLPNELLLHILASFPTPDILPLTVLSHRIYSLILRILHNRLVAATELHSHLLLLECYHPSAKLTEPPYFCAGLDTNDTKHHGRLDTDGENITRLGEMRDMYSRFRPHRRDLELGGRRVAPYPGDIPGSRTYPGSVRDALEGEAVKQTLSLEAHELFTQLVAQISLVKIGPRKGLFTSVVGVEEGVMRVWRDWLKAMNKDNSLDESARKEAPQGGKQKLRASNAKAESNVDLQDPQILWTSTSKNTGILFNVKERKFPRDVPILICTDEHLSVSYEVEFNELLIRTSHLLFTLEQSMVQEYNFSSRTVVFRSFG